MPNFAYITGSGHLLLLKRVSLVKCLQMPPQGCATSFRNGPLAKPWLGGIRFVAQTGDHA